MVYKYWIKPGVHIGRFILIGFFFHSMKGITNIIITEFILFFVTTLIGNVSLIVKLKPKLCRDDGF